MNKPIKIDLSSLVKSLRNEELKEMLHIEEDKKPPDYLLEMAMFDYARFITLNPKEQDASIALGPGRKFGHSNTTMKWAIFELHRKELIKITYRTVEEHHVVEDGESYQVDVPDPDHPNCFSCDVNIYKVSKLSDLKRWLNQYHKGRRRNELFGVVDESSVSEIVKPGKLIQYPMHEMNSALMDFPDVFFNLKQLSYQDNFQSLVDAMSKKGHSVKCIWSAIDEHHKQGRIKLEVMNRLELGNFEKNEGQFNLTYFLEVPDEYRDREWIRIRETEALKEFWHQDGGNINSKSSKKTIVQRRREILKEHLSSIGWEKGQPIFWAETANTMREREDIKELGIAQMIKADTIRNDARALKLVNRQKK